MGRLQELAHSTITIQVGQLPQVHAGELEVENLEVFFDSGLVDRLWDRDVSSLDLVTEKDLRWRPVVLLCEVYNKRISEDAVTFRGAPGRAQRTVRGHRDVFRLAIVNDSILVQIRVGFDLVVDRLDPAFPVQPFHLLHVKIRHPNTPDQPPIHQTLHGLPGLQVIHVAYLNVPELVPRVQLPSLLVRDRIMYQIQIEIIQPHSTQLRTANGFDHIGKMVGVPKFIRNEEVLSSDHSISDFRCKRLADFPFVAVNVGAVKMTVADVYCMSDGVENVAGTGFPCPQTNYGHLVPIV